LAPKPVCRTCGRQMVLLDKNEERWYCYKDDEVFLAKEQRWIGEESPRPHSRPALSTDRIDPVQLVKHITVSLALVVTVVLESYVFQSVRGRAIAIVNLFDSYTFGELVWLATMMSIGLVIVDIADRLIRPLVSSAITSRYKAKRVLNWDELVRAVIRIAALIVFWLILILPVESLADAFRSWIDPKALVGSYHVLYGLAVAYYAASGAIHSRSPVLKPGVTSKVLSGVFDRDFGVDLATKKAVVTVTGTEEGCSFLVEIPGGSSAKLKQEIRVDQDTKNSLLTEYEKTAALANYLSLTREGIKTPRPAHLLKLDMRSQLLELGQFGYRLLIPRQVAEYLQAVPELTHLWFEVDESLLDVPWELMSAQGEFLCMSYAMGRRLLTGEQYALQVRRKAGPENFRILLIGNPSEDLPLAERETDVLYAELCKMQRTDVTKRVGSEIGKRDFLTALGDGFDVIHYAGHAMYDRKEPDKSSLRFKDGFCYAYEIRQFLRENAPLVVFMNACSSAREGVAAKYETAIPSLARAFLYCGVSSYVGSMWPVHDASAAKFAALFYRWLIDGCTIGDAMRRSRIDIYRNGADEEVSWSSFILYGDPEFRPFAPRQASR
jgi:hypothetical protein